MSCRGSAAGLVRDQAGWHTTGKRSEPNNNALIPLPPTSPELNPTARIWEHLAGPAPEFDFDPGVGQLRSHRNAQLNPERSASMMLALFQSA
jgi:hypothetical protein